MSSTWTGLRCAPVSMSVARPQKQRHLKSGREPNGRGRSRTWPAKQLPTSNDMSSADSSEIVRRRLRLLNNDRYSYRTDMAAILGIRALYAAFLSDHSFFDLVRTIDAPSLIFRANRLTLPPGLPVWHKEMLQAYFLGVQHQTEELMQSSRLTLSVRESSHMMML